MEERVAMSLRDAVRNKHMDLDPASVRARARRTLARNRLFGLSVMVLLVIGLPVSLYAVTQGRIFRPAEAEQIMGIPVSEFGRGTQAYHLPPLVDIDPEALAVQYLHFTYLPPGFERDRRVYEGDVIDRTVQDGDAIVMVRGGADGAYVSLRYSLTRVRPQLIVAYAWKSTVKVAEALDAEMYGYEDDPNKVSVRWQIYEDGQWATYDLTAGKLPLSEIERILAGLR